LTTSNSTFDTLLAVYTGTRVDRLTALNANDDAGTNGVFSQLDQPVRAGTRYYIAVDGLSGASGIVLLTYTFTEVPLLDLTINATPGGVAFPASSSFPSNSVVNLTAVASNGFAFVSWTGDLLALDNPLPVTIGRVRSLTAVFAPVLYADNFESGNFRPGIRGLSNPPRARPRMRFKVAPTTRVPARSATTKPPSSSCRPVAARAARRLATASAARNSGFRRATSLSST